MPNMETSSLCDGLDACAVSEALQNWRRQVLNLSTVHLKKNPLALGAFFFELAVLMQPLIPFCSWPAAFSMARHRNQRGKDCQSCFEPDCC